MRQILFVVRGHFCCAGVRIWCQIKAIIINFSISASLFSFSIYHYFDNGKRSFTSFSTISQRVNTFFVLLSGLLSLWVIFMDCSFSFVNFLAKVDLFVKEFLVLYFVEKLSILRETENQRGWKLFSKEPGGKRIDHLEFIM